MHGSVTACWKDNLPILVCAGCVVLKAFSVHSRLETYAVYVGVKDKVCLRRGATAITWHESWSSLHAVCMYEEGPTEQGVTIHICNLGCCICITSVQWMKLVHQNMAVV